MASSSLGVLRAGERDPSFLRDDSFASGSLLSDPALDGDIGGFCEEPRAGPLCLIRREDADEADLS